MNTIANFLSKILKWIELFGFVVVAFGVLFKIMHYAGADELIMLGLLTLSSTYFLFAFAMVQTPAQDNEKIRGFTDLLVLILRKLLFIGLSVFCIAYLFALLHFPGADEMMMIGMPTLVIGSFVSIILIWGKRERTRLLLHPLFRSVAVMVWFLISLF